MGVGRALDRDDARGYLADRSELVATGADVDDLRVLVVRDGNDADPGVVTFLRNNPA